MNQQSSFVSLRYPELRWQQTEGQKGSFTLLRTDLPAGQIDFSGDRKKPSIGGCSEGQWSFHWDDWQLFNLLIKQHQGEDTLATYTASDVHNGQVSFANGSDFLLHSEGLLANRASLIDSKAQQIATYRPTDMSLSNILKVEATVEVTEQGQALPELPVLLLMTWVLVLRRGLEK